MILSGVKLAAGILPLQPEILQKQRKNVAAVSCNAGVLVVVS